jgi:hypothetical protein
MNKKLLFLAVPLIVCLTVTMFAFSRPVEKSRLTTLAAYNHRGEFSYTAYSMETPSPGTAPNALFPKILKNLTMSFTYSSPNPDPVDIQAFLADTSTGWQRQIPLTLSEGPVYTFPLDIPGLLALGDTINKELGARGNAYKISLVATVGNPGDNLIITLDGDLNAFSLIWHQDGFTKVKKGFPGTDILRKAAFGYTAELMSNSLFGPITLERPASLPVLTKLDSADSVAPGLVQYLDIGFNYQLASGIPVNSLVENVSLDLTLSETNGWTKTYILTPQVKKTGSINLIVPLDMKELLALADNTDLAAGSRAAADRQISITAQVHTVAETAAGVIDEDFSQQLTGKIGKMMTWDKTAKSGTSLLASTKAGKLTKTVKETDLFIQRLRLISIVALVISFGILAYFSFMTWRKKPTASRSRELSLKRNLKKYGELISEVNEFPPVTGTLVTVSSFNSLVKISNNALKPILFKDDGYQHSFRVVDSEFTFEHIS